MARLLCSVAAALLLGTGGSRTVDKPHHHRHHHHHSKLHVQAVPPTPEEQAIFDAKNAREAAVSAKAAAGVASKVAAHSVTINQKAQEALGNARDALHLARADVQSLTKEQAEALHKAEAKLTVKGQEALTADLKRAELKAKLQRTEENTASELTTMRSTLRELREELAHKKASGNADESDEAVDKELAELEQMLESLEADEAQGKGDAATHAELKTQIERLRELIIKKDGNTQELQGQDKQETGDAVIHYKMPETGNDGKQHVEMSYEIPAAESTPSQHGAANNEDGTSDAEATQSGTQSSENNVDSKQSSGLDIDTEMPYGELEPFGREDTAQELTESSVKESDEMVDQLERAEVAEEKRAVFRALTRLRGAAITSFDGVARSQTGNIDEYNKVHQWRKTHPLHHLADEESDISKWAFPDNADF